jgi:hypothetical protein
VRWSVRDTRALQHRRIEEPSVRIARTLNDSTV